MPALDQRKVRVVIGRDEADRLAGDARSPGAADAVQIIGRRAWQVIVDHRRQLPNIQPARGHIGGDQHFYRAALQTFQRPRACALAQVGVQRRGGDADSRQLVGHVVCAVTTGHEHQHAGPGVDLQQLPQQQRALADIDLDRALRNQRNLAQLRLHRNARWLVQQARGQGLDRRRKRGRQQQRLPRQRHQPEHTA